MNTDWFPGEEEHRRLTAKPEGETFRKAREYIESFVLHGEERITPGSDGVTERIANKRAHFLFSVEHSLAHVPNYATLDFDHVDDILDLIKSISLYIADEKRARPFNFMLKASPGEGKSHFIDCLAQKIADLRPVSFNMTSMREVNDLVPVLDGARNATIEGKIPLIFLDEFDSDKRNYALLLPLLLDGQIVLGTRTFKIGRAVIALAGSTKTLFNVIDYAQGKDVDWGQEKGPPDKSVDLISRINGGVIKIAPLDEREVDKICVAIALLRRKYGKGLRRVPASLLNFIYSAHFSYGVRSIQFLIDLLGNKKPVAELPGAKEPAPIAESVVNAEGVLDIAVLKKIFEDERRIDHTGLVYHVQHNVKEIKRIWDDSLKYHSHYVPVWCKVFSVFGQPASWVEDAGPRASYMVQELSEEFKEEQLNFSAMAGIKPYHLTRLWLDEKYGQWNHGKRNMRHVFFNLGTLHELLSEIIKDPDNARRVGERMGSAFGREFVTLSPLQDIASESEAIAKMVYNWCRFDVSGGWGMWEPVLGDKNTPQELHVKNSFLADQISDELIVEGKSRFCIIMEGYIQGVLEQIVKFARDPDIYRDIDYRVQVWEEQCGVLNRESKDRTCRFGYNIKNLDLPPNT